MRLIGLSVLFGLPGLLVGLALGLAIRRWSVLAAGAIGGSIALRYGVQRLGNGSSDNDPGVILVFALVANFIGVLVGAATGRLLAGLRHP